MRALLLVSIILLCNVVYGQGLFFESNFSDTQFTVRAKALDVVRADMPDALETALITEMEIIEVYQGKLEKGATIEVIIESDILKNYYRLAVLQGEFLTSFCSSDAGIYYTNIIYPITEKRIQAIERFQEQGTEGWDRHDCAYTNSHVQNPDDLDYEPPVPEYPGSHSNHKWRVDKDFMSAYGASLQGIDVAKWIAEFNGIGQSRYQFDIEGDQWQHIILCKLENCSVLNLSVMYNAAKSTVFGLINAQETFFIGEPSAQMKSALLTVHDRRYSKYSVEKRLYDASYYATIVKMQQDYRDKQSKTSSGVQSLIDIYVQQ